MTTYTTYGSVRGCCGHAHRTIGAAEACLRRDQIGCREQHGYSDRAVVGVRDGRLWWLTPEGEIGTRFVAGPGGASCGAARFW